MEMKVAKAPIVACLTCPLCSSLLEEATTISECLHSFCRDCIHMKLSDDDTQSCPICDVYLGVAPLEKLRPDPQLDEVRNKIFHMTTRRRVSTGGSPSSPRKRKERSLSSLGLLSAPSSSTRRKTTASRPQYYTRFTSTKDLSSSDYESEEKSDSSDTDHRRPNREDKGKAVAAGYQSPIAYLANLADADVGRSGKASSSGAVKDGPDGGKKYTRPSRPTKGVVRRREPVKIPSIPQPQVSGSAVWFALQPADNQDLPPIPTPYLRITDGRLPVSLVKKYLAAKLKLESETDVELTCRGQPVVSSLPLENVQKIWLTRPQTAAEVTSTPNVQQFLLTLTYARKTPRQVLLQQQQQQQKH